MEKYIEWDLKNNPNFLKNRRREGMWTLVFYVMLLPM